MINQSRRNFISYVSIIGIASLSGLSLQAMDFHEDGVYVNHSHLSDDAFDPDGWL